MSPVTMIKEPEAAALYTMHSLNFALRVGDAFVLCDAGGGTVDLITYEVLKLEPALELKELVPGAGKLGPHHVNAARYKLQSLAVVC